MSGGIGSVGPTDVFVALDELSVAIDRPLVLYEDLVTAASLLERIVDAETEAQTRLFADARADIRRERTLTFAGLLGLTALALLGVWTGPRGAPFRPILRAWLHALLGQRRALLRAERFALAGEAAASLAHEIRNPLAGVVLGLQNLERESEELAPRVRPMVAELERVNRTLTEHLGALRAPPETPSDVNVGGMVTELAELLRYEASDDVVVDVSVPQSLHCRTQPDRLRQVLLNLGLNALQAMDAEGGTLGIAGETEGDRLVITVRDSGPGFPQAVLQGVTAPFASERPGGTGLGLRLVRRMVAEMGGTVELANPPEGGARAVLRIPCSTEAH